MDGYQWNTPRSALATPVVPKEFQWEGHDPRTGHSRHDELTQAFNEMSKKTTHARFLSLRPSTLSGVPSRRLRLLEELHLVHHPDSWDDPITEPIFAFNNTLSLEDLRLSRPFVAEAPSLEVGWQKIKTLTEVYDEVKPACNASPKLRLQKFFKQCLPRCTALRELSICPGPHDSCDIGRLMWATPFVPFRRTGLPALRVLTLDIHYCPTNGEFPNLNFLRRFRFPNLEELTITTYGKLECPDSARITRTLRLAFPNPVPLLALDIACSSKVSARNLRGFLHSLSGTRRLMIRMSASEEFFGGLFEAGEGRDKPILGELESMELTNWGKTESERELVRRAFESHTFSRFVRAWLATPLEGGRKKRVLLREPPDDIDFQDAFKPVDILEIQEGQT